MRLGGWPWLLVMVGMALLLLEASGQSRTGAPAAGAGKANEAEVAMGARLYVGYACVQCHGLAGKGRTALQASGRSLVSTDFKRAFPLDAAVANAIKNGSLVGGDRAASMPAWNGIMSDEEINATVAYIRAGLPDLGVPLLPADTGEEIYGAFACVKCHGPLGTGGVKNVAASDPAHQLIPPLGGPEFKRKYDSPDRVRQILLDGKLVEGGSPGVVYAPTWGRIGTAEQIEKVIRYLYSR